MKKQLIRKVNTYLFNRKRYPRIDSKEDFIFEVKKPDINSSRKGDPNRCPASCAIRRVFGDAHVSRDTATVLRAIRGIVTAVRYRLSAKAIKAVIQFDATGKFPIGEYRLKAITPSQTLAAKRARNNSKVTTKKRNVRPHVKFMVRRIQDAKFA